MYTTIKNYKIEVLFDGRIIFSCGKDRIEILPEYADEVISYLTEARDRSRSYTGDNNDGQLFGVRRTQDVQQLQQERSKT